MRRRWLVALLLVPFLLPLSSLDARQGSSHRSSGHIKRNASAKRAFKRQTGYPRGRPGYVVDHKVALACGGADDPANMQWQTVGEAKAKDKWERKGCT